MPNYNKFDGLLKTFAGGVIRIKTNYKLGVGQSDEVIREALPQVCLLL